MAFSTFKADTGLTVGNIVANAATGNLTVGGNLSTNLKATIGSTLVVSGATTVSSLTSNGAISGTSGTFSSTLGVTAAATFGSTINTSGNVSGPAFNTTSASLQRDQLVGVIGIPEKVYVDEFTTGGGTVTFYLINQSLWYWTSNATGNFTVDITWDYYSGYYYNNFSIDGQSRTAVLMVTNGASAYYANSIQIDGTTSGVTTKWQGGSAPSSGNANAIDIYTFTIIKTAANTYTILASQSKFA